MIVIFEDTTPRELKSFAHDNTIVVVTALPERQRGHLIQSLQDWDVPTAALYMAPEDNTADAESTIADLIDHAVADGWG